MRPPEACISVEDRTRAVDLLAFKDVRHEQCSPHPSGNPARHAFVAGRCHVLAIALAQRTAWRMVALTRPDAPRHLVHVGALDGDVVVDVEGHFRLEVWRHRWASMTREPDLAMRTIDRAVLEDMQAQTPVTEGELALATPLAAALLAARATDERLWSLATPPTLSLDAHDRRRAVSPDMCPEMAYDAAMGGSMEDVLARAAEAAASREERVGRGVTVRSLLDADASALLARLGGSGMQIDVEGRVGLRVTLAALTDGLGTTPTTDAGRRLRGLLNAVRQPGRWPGGMRGEIHQGLVGAYMLTETWGDPDRVRTLWCDPAALARKAAERRLDWNDLACLHGVGRSRQNGTQTDRRREGRRQGDAPSGDGIDPAAPRM